MTETWWTYRYDPVSREVAVQRWTRRGITRAKLQVEYGGLTWSEALDVLDADSTSVLLDHALADYADRSE